MSLHEVITRNIKAITVDDTTIRWYDGISWEPGMLAGDEQVAYNAVFAAMRDLAWAAGWYPLLEDPPIAHAGNGHYSIRKP